MCVGGQGKTGNGERGVVRGSEGLEIRRGEEMAETGYQDLRAAEAGRRNERRERAGRSERGLTGSCLKRVRGEKGRRGERWVRYTNTWWGGGGVTGGAKVLKRGGREMFMRWCEDAV